MTRELFGDYTDSRDVIKRIEELESFVEDGDADDEDKEELKNLKEFVEEAEQCCSDWEYGETIISEDYFKEYAQELAEDIGAISRDANWPVSLIDWDDAARELKLDYISIEYDGQLFWMRQ